VDASDSQTLVEHTRELIAAAKGEASTLRSAPGGRRVLADAIPGFRILEEIGRGGMGVAYRGVQLSTKRVVALKVMLAGPFASRTGRLRFQREIELTARFQHPGIVRVLESGETSTGQLYYSMDYIEGENLGSWLSARQPSVVDLLNLFVSVCEAVEHAHSQGVVHRDLKPANVLIDSKRKPHILDFGLSKAVEETQAHDGLTSAVSVPGHVMGTLRYLSPEQAAGQPDEVDKRTDVYALGVMLFEALTGELPYNAAGSSTDVMLRIREELPRPPSSLSKSVDRELETIVLKALEKEKSRRYQAAAELGADIQRYLADEPLQAQPPSSFYILRKKISKYRVRIAVCVVSLILVIAAAGVSAWWKSRAITRHTVNEARRLVMGLQHEIERGRGNTDKLLGRLGSIATEQPDMPEVHLAHAQLHFRLALEQRREGRAVVAVDDLRRKLDQSSSQWAFRALLAEMQRALGKHEQAELLDSHAKNEAPNTAEAWFLRTFTTLNAPTAADYAKEAIRRAPDYSLAWERLAYLHLLNEEYDDALLVAQKLLSLDTDRCRWMRFQAQVFFEMEKYAESARLYSQVMDLSPGEYGPYKARAVAYLCQKKYTEAVNDFSAAVDIEGPDSTWIRYARATPLWILGRTAEAADDYRWVCAQHSSVSHAAARLFLVLHDQARQLDKAQKHSEGEEVRKEAADMLAEALSRATDSSRLSEILKCLAGDTQPEELVASIDPGDPVDYCKSYYYAGERCLLQDRNDEAREYFRGSLATHLIVQPDSLSGDPMNEWHLARWRLDQIGAVAEPVEETDGL